MHGNETKFQRNSSLARVLSLDLYWENKTYKLMRSIVVSIEQGGEKYWNFGSFQDNDTQQGCKIDC